ncbi:MAG: AbrB/MazE/SpoVT family DNA-binding domain-containing protein [ANME-2 cluster archaeon]|nr:AbrB/MazE/SpoVT family DNA-binding domain-containing protein [ANME-2 cluster archaeon]MBC2701604.1 AbrB/MazE/SpoVT family DNA-binding domain-containing protein [ANME-2 cluster archaeon]MBC2706578.1 AbrB/MazE/SpoVT family DNA-binding domain-containing protein [ANME-2 cluster archaeon]MBC2748334.1 AbrB/MazE/SpoVT family DNA-binding domain-containing protein [ANME-2 cluster archaeon]MBC2763365.1 AbrB/MazE/SpoVT family DNA-binding domain-containing protein [ANME-2 cluster archaeon]
MPLLEMRTVTITRKGQISIPKRIRDIEGFREGSKIVMFAYDDRIELRSMKQIDERMHTALASENILAKDWNSQEEDEAWKDL